MCRIILHRCIDKKCKSFILILRAQEGITFEKAKESLLAFAELYKMEPVGLTEEKSSPNTGTTLEVREFQEPRKDDDADRLASRKLRLKCHKCGKNGHFKREYKTRLRKV